LIKLNLIAGAFLILLGLLEIFVKDFAWRLTGLTSRFQKRKPERSQEWRTGTTIGGVFLIVIGILLLIQ